MNELNCRATTGATVTAIPYLLGVAQTPIALTEIGTTGRYTGHMTGAAGIYQFDFTENGVVDSTGEIEWNGTAEVTITSRLATAGYTAPDNAGIAAIPLTPLLAADYVAPDNAGITAIQAKTDNLPASPAATGDIPTAIENAGAVRTELTTELAIVRFLSKIIKNIRELKKIGTTKTLLVYDDDGVTPILSKETEDVNGDDITDIAPGLLAKERASTV